MVDWVEGSLTARRGNVTDAIFISCDNLFLVNNKCQILQYLLEFLMEIDLFALKVNTRDELHILLS